MSVADSVRGGAEMSTPWDRAVANEAVDFDYLLEVSGDDHELARELLADFVDLFPGQLDEVEKAANDGDADATRAAAHRLKGSCLAVGANSLAEILRSSEDAARAGDTAPVPPLCVEARDGFSAVVRAMEEMGATSPE